MILDLILPMISKIFFNPSKISRWGYGEMITQSSIIMTWSTGQLITSSSYWSGVGDSGHWTYISTDQRVL